MKLLLIILSFTMLSDLSSVHQDTLLKLDKNGNIIGLPEKFGPSKFDLNKKYLRIKDKEIIFPDCISYYFDILEQPKLELLASWYHSKDIMPYYLNFTISKNKENFGYSILVDLETLELIYVEVVTSQSGSTYFHKVKIEENCMVEYENGIKSAG